ncbi:MAG: TonB C-terminal domain-containing protein [Methylocystis sp.]
MKATAYVFAALLFTGAAYAKERDDASAAGNQPSPAIGAHDTQAKAKPKESRADNKAYARKVAAEIRRHSPQQTGVHGKLSVRFTIGASGRVVSHKIINASNPALNTEVDKILASVHVPPPPGGSFSADQLFVFH